MKTLRSFLISTLGILFFTAHAQLTNGPIGFVNYSDMGTSGITGGGTGEVVHVTSRADFERYATGSTPYVIILDADITGGGIQDLNDAISVGSNKTIIGGGSGHALNGVCIDMHNQHNVIFRNITLTKGREDGMAFRTCHHIWIDHCDLSDSYDGLLDFTVASDYLTCSWTKLHNHNKVSITNSGTCHYEDYGREHVTFAHCWFDQNTQRNPRIGYGRMHIYNCYWTQISSYCIGFHSQAQVLSEHNYFTSSANNPFCNQYTDQLPYCGYLTDHDSYFAKGNPGTNYAHPFTGISYSPLTYYNYDFDMIGTSSVVNETPAGVGPIAGLEYEPILNPGNGAIDVPVTQPLTWGNISGATESEMYIGTTLDNLTLTTPADVQLQAATTYYWYVRVNADGEWHSSPVYQFTTADSAASKPYPADGSTDAWLRWPSSSSAFCTDMPLTWRPAFDAAEYKVYLGTSATDLQLVGQTDNLSFTPSALSVGQTYYWRVDAVTASGNCIEGNVWSFSTPAKHWQVGKNEAEQMYLSGIAFQETNSGCSAGKCSVGDQGPGSIMGTWSGDEGTYAITTTSVNQTLGPNLIGVSLNGQLIDAWLTSDEDNSLATRQTRHTLHLTPGDEVRIEFVAGYVNGGLNESRARIDYVTFTQAEGDTVHVTRPSGIYHSPISTKGYDCEYLRLSSVLFTDSLGTVGDYGSTQVKDMYCSWITRNESSYTYYLKECAMAKFEYRNASGVISLTTQMLDYDQQFALDVPASNEQGSLYAARLYKTTPADTLYYQPTALDGYDWYLLLSPDCIFLDSQGTKGDKGKVQIRDGYDQWMKYTNPDANEVQAKNTSNGIKAFIDPWTDQKVSGFVPTGSDGSTYSYVVGTKKYMTYFLQACQKAKFYYSGTGGSSTNLTLTVTDEMTGESTEITGGDAIGKNKASNTVEAELNPNHKTRLKIIATTGDMLIYALKLWPGEMEGIKQVEDDSLLSAPVIFDLQGHRLESISAPGLYILNGQRIMLR